jgi:hypothetical protein
VLPLTFKPAGFLNRVVLDLGFWAKFLRVKQLFTRDAVSFHVKVLGLLHFKTFEGLQFTWRWGEMSGMSPLCEDKKKTIKSNLLNSI